MAHNPVPLTGVERTFADDEFIVTKTDAKGIITYCNNICLEIAGYKESEIVGQPHNILRHPDMPRCIFKFLWDTISSGREVLAYVINKGKYGDHYWVMAHVTPTFDENKNIIGYLSSRRNCRKDELDVIKPLYKTLLEEEAKYSSKKEGMEAGLNMLLGILEEKGMTNTEFVMKLRVG
jgi:PAS domain S-box-containing protein